MRSFSVVQSARATLARMQTESRKRYAYAGATAISSIINRGTSLGVSLVTVRLTYRYLGEERYGMWVTITSLVAMFAAADLGMGNSVVNMVAEALALGNIKTVKQIIVSAFVMLSIFASVAILGMSFVFTHISASALFNVHSAIAVREAGSTLLAVFLCFSLSLPLGAVRGTLLGMQRGYVSSAWNIAGSIASLGAVLIAIRLRAGLPILAISVAAPPVLASALNGAHLFFASHSELRPRFSDFSWTLALRILRTGVMFLLLQLSYVIGMQTDNIVIAQILGPKAVSDYSVPSKLYNIVLALLIILSGSLWPAYTDAMATRDREWIVNAFRRVTIVGTTLAVVSSAALYLFANRILSVWVGSSIQASRVFLVLLGAMCITSAYLQPMSFLLNGLSRFRVQVICGLVMAALNLGLSIVFVERYGIIGAILGTVVATIAVQVIPLTIFTRLVLRRDLRA